MDSSALVIIGKILALIFLVLLNGFFVAAEFAIVKVRDTQLQPLIKRGHSRARSATHVLAHLEDDLRRLLAEAQRRKRRGPALGRDIVLNARELRERVARDVMRPRQEIVFLDTTATTAECLNIAEKTRFCRFPLCEDGDPG